MKTLILVASMGLAACADDAFMGEVGKHALGILEGADRVETFRTHSERDETVGANVVDGYPVVKTGPEKDAAFAKRILSQLKHEETEPNDLECAFVPHDAFRVWKGKEHVDVLICFHCDQVQVTSFPPKAAEPIRALGDFEEKSGPWFVLCREAFPDDGDLGRMEAAKLGPSKKVKEFLGDGIVGIIQDFDLVEIFRIKPKEEHHITGPRIEDQDVLGRSDEDIADLDMDLKGSLLDEGTYSFRSVKGCTFEPGLAFRIQSKKSGTIEILVCFSCDEVMITRIPDGDAKPEPRKEDCDGARPALLRIAKAAFPDDKVIQGLKVERGK
ncbi:MAG: hypothetical protein AAB074_05595 [Planctomycetota bacterium]